MREGEQGRMNLPNELAGDECRVTVTSFVGFVVVAGALI
jgi:hypothetical protein